LIKLNFELFARPFLLLVKTRRSWPESAGYQRGSWRKYISYDDRQVSKLELSKTTLAQLFKTIEVSNSRHKWPH